MGCPAPAEDSTKHYCRCPVTRDFAIRRLRFSPSQDWPRTFLLCDRETRQVRYLARAALLVYSVSRTVQTISVEAPWRPESSFDAMESFLLRGADGHRFTRKIMATLWS